MARAGARTRVAIPVTPHRIGGTRDPPMATTRHLVHRQQKGKELVAEKGAGALAVLVSFIAKCHAVSGAGSIVNCKNSPQLGRRKRCGSSLVQGFQGMPRMLLSGEAQRPGADPSDGDKFFTSTGCCVSVAAPVLAQSALKPRGVWTGDGGHGETCGRECP
ncbi:hypothetical protein NDU88_000790 [Pleurodeles waltl]|uniref:Uncharacterized protein n=1 Tax=Pleurodeles waltl TaxID=8319 RepID=A0AAV7SAN2_PLEWA|nr:hypothetical protein NDU88_000790 [Pleurodeles waltl]